MLMHGWSAQVQRWKPWPVEEVLATSDCDEILGLLTSLSGEWSATLSLGPPGSGGADDSWLIVGVSGEQFTVTVAVEGEYYDLVVGDAADTRTGEIVLGGQAIEWPLRLCANLDRAAAAVRDYCLHGAVDLETGPWERQT